MTTRQITEHFKVVDFDAATDNLGTGDPDSNHQYETLFMVNLTIWAEGLGHVNHPWIEIMTTPNEREHAKGDPTFRVKTLLAIMTGSRLRPVGDRWFLKVDSNCFYKVLGADGEAVFQFKFVHMSPAMDRDEHAWDVKVGFSIYL